MTVYYSQREIETENENFGEYERPEMESDVRLQRREKIGAATESTGSHCLGLRQVIIPT